MNVSIWKGIMENEQLQHKLSDAIINFEIMKIGEANLWDEVNVLKQDLMNATYEWNQVQKNFKILESDFERIGHEILNSLVNLKSETNRELGI